MNRSSRCVRIYSQRGPIGGRGCIEQANRKQVAMKIFVAQGDINILNKIASWAAYLTFLTSVFFMDLLYDVWDPDFSNSRSYSHFSMNPRCRLHQGLKKCLKIPKIVAQLNKY
jgi:hypothetical protein